MKKFILIIICNVLLVGLLQSQNKINNYEYWFDNNFSGKIVTNLSIPASEFALQTEISVSMLTDGLHTFHVRFRDERGQWSSVLSQFFQKLPATISGSTNTMTAYEYWLDNNYADKVLANFTPQTTFQLIDSLTFASASNGLHTFHIRFRDERGQWSSVLSQFFQKLPATNSASTNTMTAYEYWLDNNYADKVLANFTPQTTFQLIDSLTFASAPNGLHTFHIRFRDERGQWSSVLSQFFQKLPATISGSTNAMTAYEYWLDNNYADKVEQSILSTQQFQLIDSIPFALVSNGLHTFHIRFKDERGQWSTVLSQFFQKLPAINANIPNLITAYQYWVDTTAATRTLVNLPIPSNPYELLTELDFAWVPKGNHDFQIQFKDTLGQWSCVLTDTFYKYPTPRALFIADKYVLCDTGTISFTSQSFDADTLLWDFGDGTFSSLNDPTHFYGAPGEYQVKLLAFDTTQSVKDSVTINIKVSHTPIFNLPATISTCSGVDLLIDAGNVGDAYLWSTGDTTSSIMVSTAGNYWIKVTNENLCSLFDTISVVVNPLPIVSISGLDTDYCNTSGMVSLTGNPLGGVFSGPGISGNSFNPLAVTAGYHTISYRYTNGLGCTDSSQKVVHVIVCDNIREFSNIGAFNIYPNPFNYNFNIDFSLKKESDVKIKLMDITNRELGSILNERKQEGDYTVYYDGSHLPVGIYYVYIIIDHEYVIKRIVRVN